MLKIKFKLTYTDAVILQNYLTEIINTRAAKTRSEKMMLALLVECFIKLQAATFFTFEGEKGFSFTMPQSIALLEILLRYKPGQESSPYVQVLFDTTTAIIDQKLS